MEWPISIFLCCSFKDGHYFSLLNLLVKSDDWQRSKRCSKQKLTKMERAVRKKIKNDFSIYKLSEILKDEIMLMNHVIISFILFLFFSLLRLGQHFWQIIVKKRLFVRQVQSRKVLDVVQIPNAWCEMANENVSVKRGTHWLIISAKVIPILNFYFIRRSTSVPMSKARL